MTTQMRRNLLLLAACQAMGQAVNTMMFAATALSVATFLPQHRELATLPVTMQHLGVMLSVFPTALLMQRFGRRRFGLGAGLHRGGFAFHAHGFGLGVGFECVLAHGFFPRA